MVKLGDVFPNFKADSTTGPIEFHQWMSDSWCILFSHPADFTPVCTSELAQVVTLMPEFKKRGVKVIAISCDRVEIHHQWIKDIKIKAKYYYDDFPYPILSDENRNIAIILNMIDPNEKDAQGIPLPARAVFIIGPDKTMRLSILYPATTGRNFDEILRVIDSLQLCDKFPVATPVNWKPGNDVCVLPTISDEEVHQRFPKGITVTSLASDKKYYRTTPQPL